MSNTEIERHKTQYDSRTDRNCNTVSNTAIYWVFHFSVLPSDEFLSRSFFPRFGFVKLFNPRAIVIYSCSIYVVVKGCNLPYRSVFGKVSNDSF
jgi:hypothetical protein